MQGWEIAHWLISLKSNEQLWAIRSVRSRQMSDCEPISGCSWQMGDCDRIAQIAHDKWATVSNLLRWLMINEQMSDSLKKLWLKKSKILFFSMFYICLLFKKISDSLIPTFLVSESSGRSPKKSDVSESLRLLIKNEGPWVIRSGGSPKMSEWVNRLFFIEQIAHFFAKN